MERLFKMFKSRTDKPKLEKKPSVLHVVWWEGTVENPLVDAQLVEPLRRLARTDKDFRWILLSAGPFLKAEIREWMLCNKWFNRIVPNRGIRNWLDHQQRRTEMEKDEILYITRETLFGPHTIYLHWGMLLFFPWVHCLFMARLIRKENVVIVHCRSYSATWVALLTRAFTRTSFKLVFDMRGLLPEEGLIYRAYKRAGLSFRLWKFVERILLKNADLILSPSETFTEYVSSIYPGGRYRTIYTHSPVDVFAKTERNAEIQKLYAPLIARKVLVYLGSLGSTSWHSMDHLASLFKKFKAVFEGNATLLIISKADKLWLNTELHSLGINGSECVLLSSSGAMETASLLKLGDYGALPYRTEVSKEEKLIGYTMIASKTGEYLAAGLPILCHSGIGAASRLVSEECLGFLFDSRTSSVQFEKDIKRIEDTYGQVVKKCQKFAERFDIENNIREYSSEYRRMLNQQDGQDE